MSGLARIGGRGAGQQVVRDEDGLEHRISFGLLARAFPRAPGPREGGGLPAMRSPVLRPSGAAIEAALSYQLLDAPDDDTLFTVAIEMLGMITPCDGIAWNTLDVVAALLGFAAHRSSSSRLRSRSFWPHTSATTPSFS